MKTLASLLSRFKDFTPPALAVERAVKKVLKEKFDIDMPERSIRYTHGVVHIALGGAQKTELLLNKREILSALKVEVGDSVKDIR